MKIVTFNINKRLARSVPGIENVDLLSATSGSIGGGKQGVTTRLIQLGAKVNF